MVAKGGATVTIYSVGTGSLLRGWHEAHMDLMSRMSVLQAGSFPRTLAEKTGGPAWFPRFETAFLAVIKGIMQALARQYRLVHVSKVPSRSEFCKISLEAVVAANDQREELDVRVREGWRG